MLPLTADQACSHDSHTTGCGRTHLHPTGLRWKRATVGLAAFLLSCLLSASAQAQTFISRIPDQAGTWAKYEGPHIEKTFRPKSEDGDLQLTWRCDLTIKALDQEMAEYKGKQVPCRWLEFKVEFKSAQAQAKEQDIQAAGFGTRLYKVLVPESAATERNRDALGLPVTYLPVVRGYRKIADREPTPVQEKVLIVYPLIAMLTHYDNLKKDLEENVDLPQGMSVKARSYKGSRVLSNNTSRSSNEGTLWFSDETPFGLVKYSVKVQRFEKDATDPIDAFQPSTELTSELTLVGTGTDAQSELPDLK